MVVPLSSVLLSATAPDPWASSDEGEASGSELSSGDGSSGDDGDSDLFDEEEGGSEEGEEDGDVSEPRASRGSQW